MQLMIDDLNQLTWLRNVFVLKVFKAQIPRMWSEMLVNAFMLKGLPLTLFVLASLTCFFFYNLNGLNKAAKCKKKNKTKQ